MTSFGPTHWQVQETTEYKVATGGFQTLTDRELLSIILGSPQAAITLLSHYDSLSALARTSEESLASMPSVSEYMGYLLAACFELGRRKDSEDISRVKVKGSESLARYLQVKYGDRNCEVFLAVYLNRNHEIIAEQELFVGGVSSTIVDPKVVFKTAVERLASAVIVAHNHPSGSLRPSQADINITKKLVQAGQSLDIVVLDHIIVSRQGYYSFADEGAL